MVVIEILEKNHIHSLYIDTQVNHLLQSFQQKKYLVMLGMSHIWPKYVLLGHAETVYILFTRSCVQIRNICIKSKTSMTIVHPYKCKWCLLISHDHYITYVFWPPCMKIILKIIICQYVFLIHGCFELNGTFCRPLLESIENGSKKY